jgi:hypothetical protein
MPCMGTATVADRILTTREMADLLGYDDTDWISKLCRAKKIPGAWRLDNGNWRIHASAFRQYMVGHGIPTHDLDRLLETN